MISKGKVRNYMTYAIGEIALVVIGILIALGINNWNTKNKSDQEKAVIISKIKDEVYNNSQELDTARFYNQKIIEAHKAYSEVYHGTSSQILTTSARKSKLQSLYPSYFRAKDSTLMDSNKYLYSGDTFIILEIPDITSIAWETIKTVNIANEFDYDCLYQLESLYNLQSRVQKEIDKAADALQQGALQNLFRLLNVINQLDSQLKTDYDAILKTIDNCD